MENQEQPQAKLESLNKEIASLSSQLKDLGAKKEAKYKEKEARDQELNSLIKAAQELRDKKAKIDAEVKGLKAIRDVNNKSLKEYYSKLAEKKSVQQPADKKIKVRLNPAAIKKQIEAMLFSIETEGISFDREKAYMGKIKQLKVQLAEIEKEDAAYAEARQMRTEIGGKKKDADEAHDKIQKLAAESSDIFAQLKEKSEQIAKAKKSRSALQADVKELKTQLDAIDSKLVSVLSQWSEITKSAPPIEMRAPQPSTQISEMEQLKTKKKFTKEDILAMQKQAMRRR